MIPEWLCSLPFARSALVKNWWVVMHLGWKIIANLSWVIFIIIISQLFYPLADFSFFFFLSSASVYICKLKRLCCGSFFTLSERLWPLQRLEQAKISHYQLHSLLAFNLHQLMPMKLQFPSAALHNLPEHSDRYMTSAKSGFLNSSHASLLVLFCSLYPGCRLFVSAGLLYFWWMGLWRASEHSKVLQMRSKNYGFQLL